MLVLVKPLYLRHFIRFRKGYYGLFLTQLIYFVFSELIRVKTELVQFAQLKIHVRALERREQESQDSSSS